jgi:hypothetical protein
MAAHSPATERLIIFHNHLFKNAGSTIDWALRRNFGKAFVDHRDNRNMQRGAAYLGPYFSENPWILALSTHHFRPPLPTLEKVRFITIMMFRHPIERVLSVYNFERQQIHADTLGAKFARDHDLREYVLWRMRPDVPPTIRNFHVYRSLPMRIKWQVQFGENEFEDAKRYVRSVNLLGFVDSFDESMVSFENALRTRYLDIDLSYRAQNIFQDFDEPREYRIEKLKRLIGEDVFHLLVKENKYDVELYNYARQLFDKRLSLIPNLGVVLEDLRKRCTDYRNTGFLRSLVSN